MSSYEEQARYAISLHRAGNYRKAVNIYESLLESRRFSDHELSIRTNLASALWRLDDPLNAAQQIKYVLAKSPHCPDAILIASRIGSSLGETNNAVRLYSHYLGLTSSKASSQNWHDIASELLAIAGGEPMLNEEVSLLVNQVLPHINPCLMSNEGRARFALYLGAEGSALEGIEVIIRSDFRFGEQVGTTCVYIALKALLGKSSTVNDLARLLPEAVEELDYFILNNLDILVYYLFRLGLLGIVADLYGRYDTLVTERRTLFYIATAIQKYSRDFKRAKKIYEKVIEGIGRSAVEYEMKACYQWSLLALAVDPYRSIAWEYYGYRTRYCLNSILGRNTKNPYEQLAEWRPLEGYQHLMLGKEQGIGDQLVFLRLIRAFAKTFPALRISVEVDRKIWHLARHLYRDDSLNILYSGQRLAWTAADFDSFMLLGDIGRYIGADQYLEVKSMQAASDRGYRVQDMAKNSFAEGRKITVGIFWRSRRVDNEGKAKNLSLSAFDPLVLPETEFVCLQDGITDEERCLLQKWKARVPLIDCGEDIEGLVNIVGGLDCVVTCSASLAHISCSIGVKTHVLVAESLSSTYWYWGCNGAKSPIYPSAQVHRGIEERLGEIMQGIKRLISQSDRERE